MQHSFELLADPTRRRLLDELRSGEAAVGQLVERLERSQPLVSKHLRALLDGGFVSVRKEAQRRIYRLEPDRLREFDDWLQPYRAYWEGRLDRLERTLDEMPERGPESREKSKKGAR